MTINLENTNPEDVYIDKVWKINKGTGEKTCCCCHKKIIRKKIKFLAYLEKACTWEGYYKQFFLCFKCWGNPPKEFYFAIEDWRNRERESWLKSEFCKTKKGLRNA